MSVQDVDIVVEHTPRKPRIALMGEFSAGKSTLMNLLLGCDPMPVRITATRVPPVWVSHGPRSASLVGEDGTVKQFDGDDLSAAPMDGCDLIRFSMDSDILNLCDLIDIPGISDPNLKHETWLTLMEDVDCVIWCTHATQAWRQSEAALWEQVSQQIKGPNHLVVTQFDKLRSERDQRRVMARLQAEAGDVFDDIIPISTLEAINAGMDETAWRNSGGAALIERLVAMLVDETGVAAAAQGNVNAVGLEESQASPPSAVTTLSKTSDTPCATAEAPSVANDAQKKVVPRRVRPQTPNPERPSSDELQEEPLQFFGGAGEF
ncbi:dynamin family protein [Shimia sagamensis]|uniref:Dynamin family protein n=1 Tax=Shimia sagamensis TaxID=1566352 RepID=A0ABY1PBX4_9RHOB|nr:dynamin family protein [Shimia sagamensis]SMP31026.1 Dynamin family protein [Shimia sagamensis]